MLIQSEIPVAIPRMVDGKPVIFHDGLTLPAGTRIAFPVDSYMRDPDVFRDPEKFNGFRFIDLERSSVRNGEGVVMWNASHANKLNLGSGFPSPMRHLCSVC